MVRGAPLLATILTSAALGGCVDVYQPMTGLHRPIAIDVGYTNFTDLDLRVRCRASAAMDAGQAGELCRRVARLFENQGARVEVLRDGAPPIEEPEDAAEAQGEKAKAPRAALSIEIAGREIRRETTTLIPWLWEHTSDYTVAQDITVRDETGFLLAADTFVFRFVSRVGFFSDAEEQFSADFYGQISQLALNAKVRRRVLAEGKRQPGSG